MILYYLFLQDQNELKKPTQVCFIDWQLSSYALPTLDLVHFFYTSSPKDVLQDYKKFLKIYHDNLTNNLREMSCDTESILSFEDLLLLWKKSSVYGLYISGFMFKILYIDGDNVPEEISEEARSMDDYFKEFKVSEIEEKINIRLSDLFNFIVQNDLL